jgi:hypothetical protein
MIAEKPVTETTAEEFHRTVLGMGDLQRPKVAPLSDFSPGLSIKLSAKGEIRVRRSKRRAFAYITHAEIAAHASALGIEQAVIWNVLSAKDYILARTRLEAERTYAVQKGLTWDDIKGTAAPLNKA